MHEFFFYTCIGLTYYWCRSICEYICTITGFQLHGKNRENCSQKIPDRESTGNLEILPKHRGKQGILYAQVVNA